MKKQEAEFTTKFKNWATSSMNSEFGTFVCEIKVTKGGESINRSDIKEHQILALENAKHGKYGYKIPDTGYQNPFDLVVFDEVPAFLVLAFYYPRKCYKFWVLDVDAIHSTQRYAKNNVSSISEETLARLEFNEEGFYCEGFELPVGKNTETTVIETADSD